PAAHACHRSGRNETANPAVTDPASTRNRRAVLMTPAVTTADVFGSPAGGTGDGRSRAVATSPRAAAAAVSPAPTSPTRRAVSHGTGGTTSDGGGDGEWASRSMTASRMVGRE